MQDIRLRPMISSPDGGHIDDFLVFVFGLRPYGKGLLELENKHRSRFFNTRYEIDVHSLFNDKMK